MDHDFATLFELFQRANYCFRLSIDRAQGCQTTGELLCTFMRRSLKLACLRTGFKKATVASEFVPGTDSEISPVTLPSSEPILLRYHFFVYARKSAACRAGLIATQMELLTYPGEERSAMDRALMPIRATTKKRGLPCDRLAAIPDNRHFLMGVYFPLFTATRTSLARYFWHGAVIQDIHSDF